MITNTGKNIIAKYLIGDAPAYASYIALGCGPKPRPNITTASGVSTGTISGSIVTAANTTAITGISSTAGLVVGMTLIKTAGTGAFGGTTGTTVITSIDSLSQITVTSTAANTTGTITFNTNTVASILSVADTDGLWIGAKVTITSGTGVLASNVDTLITAINSNTSFTVTPAPTTLLSGATLYLEIDPNKQSLDFEMFRVPVSSRGYVNDSGVNKIILTAQLPTEERYEISEIGIYSAGSNTAATPYDSKTISAFSDAESWEFSVGNTLNSPSITSTVFPEIQNSLINGLNTITSSAKAIKTNTTNGVFSNPTRAARYERPRYLSNAILLKGNTSYIYPNNGGLAISGTPSFLQVTGETVDLSKNSSSDLLKIAFSIVSVDGNSSDVPDSAKIIIEFTNNDGSQYAKMFVDAKDSVYRFANNRYITVAKRLDQLSYSTGQFSWKNVTTIKAYVATTEALLVTNKAASGGTATLTTASSHGLVTGNYVQITGVDSTFNGTYEVTGTPTADTFTYAKTGTVATQAVVPSGRADVPTDKFFIALDALRLDNISTVNPLYGMTGYSIIQNAGEDTIIKSPNTNNYIEYRFILDVT